MRIFLALLGLWAVTHDLCHAKVNEDSLARIVSEGITHSFGIKSQELKLEQARNRKNSAWFNLLPVFSLAGGTTMITADQISSGQIQSTYSSSNSLKATASWTVWDNFQSIRDIQTNSVALSAEKKTSRREIQQYVLNLLESFLSYQLLLNRQEVLEGLLEQSKWTDDESSALVKAGAKTKLDSMDTEIQVVNTERDILENKNSIAAAERNLAVLLNSEKIKNFPRIDLLSLNPYYMNDFAKHLGEIKSRWKNQLLELNPDLGISRLLLEKAQMELSQTKLSYFPKTYVSVSHEYNMDRQVQQDPTDGTRANLQTTTVSLGFTWQFWDWLNTPRLITNAQNDFQISLNQFEENRHKTSAEIENLLEQHDILEKSIVSSKLVLEKAVKQLAYSKEMYRLGRITLLTMQQSTSRVFESRIALADRLKSHYILAAKILYSLGYELQPADVDMKWTE